MGECWQQKHIQLALSTKMECDYFYAWIFFKKWSHLQKSHGKVEEEEGQCWKVVFLGVWPSQPHFFLLIS